MIIDGERALAYVVAVDEIKPLEGYDRVEYARTNGWWCIVSKNDGLKVGDKCVYFEVDSKVPATDERFAFLESRKYHVKTIKMCKVYSQGLLMPLSMFPELGDAEIGTNVTEKLGVTYYEPEDNVRKAKLRASKYTRMTLSHPKLFKFRFVRWLSERKFGRKILLLLFGMDKRTRKIDFPKFLKKTDEERVENQPWRVGDGKLYLLTEKLDGTSCTYAVRRIRGDKFEFYVCSRNLRKLASNQDNIYWELAKKYRIQDYLEGYMRLHPMLEWICIQGEGVGNVQGNPLKLEENDLYLFNFITSRDGRYGSLEGKRIAEGWGMKWVPILGEGKTQKTMEELKEFADGYSVVNPEVLREGIVYRSFDGKDSFKNVSRKYLMGCVVTFDMNGCEATPIDAVRLNYGSKISIPEEPIAEGYNFCGWYKEGACENEWDFGKEKVTEDTTLFAKWTAVA